MLNQSFYWCKVLERLADAEFREKYRSEPQNNIDFDKGPWLKPQISALAGGRAGLRLTERTIRSYGSERRLHIKAIVTNDGNIPLFPVKLDIAEDKTLVLASDNYLFLPPEESRNIELEVRIRDDDLRRATLVLTAWNAEPVELAIEL